MSNADGKVTRPLLGSGRPCERMTSSTYVRTSSNASQSRRLALNDMVRDKPSQDPFFPLTIYVCM